MLFWILSGYFIAVTIAFVVGVGPAPGNSRKMYWWEYVLTAPFIATGWMSMRFPLSFYVIFPLLTLYAYACIPLAWAWEKFQLWRYNRSIK